MLAHTDPSHTIQLLGNAGPAVMFALFGGTYAFAGFLKNLSRSPSERFDWRRALRPVFIGMCAGALVAVTPGDLSLGALEATMAAAAPIVDQLISGLASKVHGLADDAERDGQ